MPDRSAQSRVFPLLATLLVVIVVGLAATLAVLKYRRGRHAAPAPTPPPVQPNNPPPPVQPGDDKRTVKERVRALTQEARAAMQEHDNTTAFEKWREAHELVPEDSEIAAEYEAAREQWNFDLLCEQGEAALFVEDPDQALVNFQKALEIRPKEKSVKERVAFCNYWKCKKAGDAAAEKKDWKTAQTEYEKALGFNPQSDELKKALAEVKKQLGPLPPVNPPPVNPPSTVAQLQDKINALDKENKIESFSEAEKHCDELAKLLKDPDQIKKVAEMKKLIGDKRAGYEKIYATKLQEVREALKAGAPGLALSALQSLKGKYKKDTSEVDALIKEAQQQTVISDVVLIPDGVYQVGSDDLQDGNPRRQFLLSHAIFLDRHEITNVQYKAFIDATGHRWPKHWTEGKFAEGQNHYPVMGVTYEDAVAFCTWANRRLPTEGEWEVAASGGQPRRYPWGDEFLPDRANTREGGRTGPTIGGSQPEGKSLFGALDMIGNVAEWVDGTAAAPDDPKHLLHIAKGGSFLLPANLCTIASRQLEEGSVQLYGFGFRTVVDATPEAIQKWKEANPPQPPSETSHK